eukprot:3725374-Prymnesium_polylepis.1
MGTNWAKGSTARKTTTLPAGVIRELVCSTVKRKAKLSCARHSTHSDATKKPCMPFTENSRSTSRSVTISASDAAAVTASCVRVAVWLSEGQRRSSSCAHVGNGGHGGRFGRHAVKRLRSRRTGEPCGGSRSRVSRRSDRRTISAAIRVGLWLRTQPGRISSPKHSR